MLDQPVIECQQCGCVLARLSPGQAQEVALNPYNFIRFCRSCESDINGATSARCSVCDGTLDDCTCDIGWDIDDTPDTDRPVNAEEQ